MHTKIPSIVANSALSPARLNAYRTFFKANSDSEALGAFQWNQSISMTLWPLVSLLELALRNRVHFSLSGMYGGGSASYDWYSGGGGNKMQLSPNATRKVAEIMDAKAPDGSLVCQSIDDFVATVSFGFWVEAMRQVPKDRRYRLVRSVFPHYVPVSDKSLWTHPNFTWNPLISRLQRHKSFRDRLAHYRPMWRWTYSPNPGDALRLPASAGSAMISLRTEVREMTQTLKEMDPALVDLWQGSFPQTLFASLTTTNALHHFIHRPSELSSLLKPFKNPRHLAASELQAHGPARFV